MTKQTAAPDYRVNIGRRVVIHGRQSTRFNGQQARIVDFQLWGKRRDTPYYLVTDIGPRCIKSIHGFKPDELEFI